MEYKKNILLFERVNKIKILQKKTPTWKKTKLLLFFISRYGGAYLGFFFFFVGGELIYKISYFLLHTNKQRSVIFNNTY